MQLICILSVLYFKLAHYWAKIIQGHVMPKIAIDIKSNHCYIKSKIGITVVQRKRQEHTGKNWFTHEINSFWKSDDCRQLSLEGDQKP